MVEFIKITHSLNEALAYNASGQENPSTYYFGGVQILPDHPYPYVQRTYHKEGIEIEDFKVWVCDTCGNEIEEISANFNVVRIFQDINGKPQIEWSLNQIPTDYGYRLVLLKILQGVNDYFYTTPFYITSYNIEQTSRWDYRNSDDETMLSCQLQVFFRQPMSEMNIVSRNRIDTGRRVMDNIQNPEFELWKTQDVDKEFFKKFKNIFLSRQLYVDFQKTTLWEGIDTPEIEFDQNFLEANFSISRNENNIYDPNYTPPPIPPIPPVDPKIVLDSVVSLNQNQVRMSFHLINLSLSAVTLQYSEDGIFWIGNNTGSTISPRTFTVPNNNTDSFFYRIKDASSDIVSNVLQLIPPSLKINSVTGQPGFFVSSGNTYYISWEFINQKQISNLVFEASVNNIIWQKMLYSTGNQNPKQTQVQSSLSEFKYFRIRDLVSGLISNVFFHEF